MFEGLNHTSYRVEYTANPDCMSHHTFEDIVSLPERSSDLRLSDLWNRACRELNSTDVTLEFSRDIIQALSCSTCGAVEAKFVPVGSLSFEQGRCPKARYANSKNLSQFSRQRPCGSRFLDQLGLPAFDIFTARAGEQEIAYLMAGDQELALGTLAAAHS